MTFLPDKKGPGMFYLTAHRCVTKSTPHHVAMVGTDNLPNALAKNKSNAPTTSTKPSQKKGESLKKNDWVDPSETTPKSATTKRSTTMDINTAHDLLSHASEKILCTTCEYMGFKLSGTMNTCEGCGYAKARQANVKKKTTVKATEPGARLFFRYQWPFQHNYGWHSILDTVD